MGQCLGTSVCCPKRTNKSFREDTLNDYEEIKTVNGVKNPTWFHLFSNFDLVNGIAIDYMQGIGLGALKLLMKLWFSKSLKKQTFSIHDKLSQVDERLEEIKLTIEISRPPRSYSKYGTN